MSDKEFLLRGVIHLGVAVVLLLGAVVLLLRVVRQQRREIKSLLAQARAKECTLHIAKPMALDPSWFDSAVRKSIERLRRNGSV